MGPELGCNAWGGGIDSTMVVCVWVYASNGLHYRYSRTFLTDRIIASVFLRAGSHLLLSRHNYILLDFHLPVVRHSFSLPGFNLRSLRRFCASSDRQSRLLKKGSVLRRVENFPLS